MISKKRLLSGLRELLYVEEAMITLFVNFDKVLVDLVEDMDPQKKDDMKKLLSVLYHDSSGHKEKIDNMMAKIEGSPLNEY